MAKTNNKILALTPCDGCGGEAAIKQRSNGKRLFYLHCSKCGADQRSGAQIQAKWAATVSGSGSESTETNTEIKTEPTPKKQADSVDDGEWSPEQPSTPKSTPKNTESNTESTPNWGAIGFGVLTVICLGIGIKLKA